MPLLHKEIITVLNHFAPVFSKRVWNHVQVLVIGAILCIGKRTVTSILRVMGLKQEKRFERYHRVLNKARWSGLAAAKILLGLLVQLLPAGFPIVVGVDETIERRKGKKINGKGYYRDAVRSTQKNVVKCYGLKWISMMILIPLPWSSRPWALPFLTVLAPSRKANEKKGKVHKTTIDWTMQMVRAVSRWLGNKLWILVGDGGYASVRLGHMCRESKVSLISRLRLDAQLYDFPEPAPIGKRGRKPKKGKRLVSLKYLAEHGKDWREEEVKWYGGTVKSICLMSGICLWHTPGEEPLPIRWVLVADPKGEARTEAFLSTNLELAPKKIIEFFVMRWNVEVTFEESRAHLGVETQRQWSDKAISRSTPALLGIFSLVCLMAYHLKSEMSIIPQSSAWYIKTGATFSDVLALVRRTLWAGKYFNMCTFSNDHIILKRDELELIIGQLAMAA